jgi:serine phosphatase RsbU (regulator of sigma subunit)
LALTRVEASLSTATLAAFEQGLIPHIEPPSGLLVDTRYRPGLARLRLGGDFMDVVTLPTGDTAFVIGDVSGHGPAEAAFAVGVHAGWRTLAKVDPHNPAGWFAMLDETFFDAHPERMCTALAGLIDVTRKRFTVFSAGHPPPVVVGRGAYVADVPSDPLLGIGFSERRKEHSITLRDEQGLLFYTDGLLKQPKPDDPEQRWREEDLLAWLAGRGTVENVDLDALLWDFGRNAFTDDIAVMLVRFAPDP